MKELPAFPFGAFYSLPFDGGEKFELPPPQTFLGKHPGPALS